LKVFGWLFQRVLTKDQAVAAAMQFLAQNGYRVVGAELDVDFTGEDMPVVFQGAALPSKRWHVQFHLLTPPGLWRSHTAILVQVDAHTGEAKFDGPEELEGD
jgi:hypothetical protein